MTDATTPTLKPMPDFTSKSARQRSYFWATISSLEVGFEGAGAGEAMNVWIDGKIRGNAARIYEAGSADSCTPIPQTRLRDLVLGSAAEPQMTG